MKLREFTLKDAQRVSYLLGDKAVSEWTANIPYPYDKSDAKEWIERTVSSNERHPFAIELNGTVVGCVSFWPHGKEAVEVGYWVGKEYWGQGIATQALKILMSNSTFPNVTEVVAKVMKGNIGSKRVLSKCGFKLKKACLIPKLDSQIEGCLYILSREV